MKTPTINYFKIVCIITSALFAYLFFVLLFNSDSFINGIGLKPSETTFILARRTSIFMFGISVLLYGAKNLPDSKARQIICFSAGITLIGLASMSCYELIKGTVNSSMLQAFIIEITLGIIFGLIYILNRFAKNNQMKVDKMQKFNE
jgi:hypothetical protein